MMRKFLLLFICLINGAFANPQGGSVVSGEASIVSQGQGTTITQSTQSAWIDWQEFSINSDEWVHFNQLLESGLSVNRVTGNEVSEILGQLTSNGTVYLVNPNGVLFGETSHVDVGALFATDHWLEDDGTLTSPNSDSQGVRVLGLLSARDDITLLAQNIVNEGIVQGDNVQLLASHGALLHLDESGSVSVLVPADESQSAWIENTGAVIANDQIVLGSAHKNDWLNQLAAEANVSVSGELSANTIDINGSNVDVMSADLTAQLIDIESQQTTYIGDSNLSAVDQTIRIRGQDIQLHSGTAVDVGSGQLSVGGYYQGQGNDNNADFVHVSSTVHLYGNGGATGDGGEIIIWSDGTTSFSGNIEAQGGTQSGDGGFVEVSGKETLIFRGDVLTTASYGAMGTLLLDPDTITIADGSGASTDSDGTVLFADYTGQNITIYEQTLEGIAAGTNITLQADDAIYINDLSDNALTLNQTGSVNFNVSSDTLGVGGVFQMLDTNDAIVMTGGGDLSISVFGNVAKDTGIGIAPYTALVEIGDIQMTTGGNVGISAGAQGAGTTSDEIIVSIEDITIIGNGDIVLTADNTENTGAETVTMDVGNVTVTGAGGNSFEIFVGNNNQASGPGLDVVGNVALNLNGDISLSGDGTLNHYLDISLEEDLVVGGTINNYGDMNTFGGDITISADRMELLDTDLRNVVSALNANSAGGDVDLTAFGAASIDGNGTHSFNIETTTVHNLDWDEFTDVRFLVYQTTGNVELGVDGAKNVSNAEMALVDAGADRFTVQTTDNITTTNAVIATQLSLFADRNRSGSGSIILNGLNTTNTNLTLQAADLSGDGTATQVGTGTLTVSGATSQDISIGNVGTSTFNIESNVWNNMTSANHTVTAGSSSTIWWENGSLGNDTTLDASSGAGIVFQGANRTFGGAHTLQLIGDSYFSVDVSMTAVGSSLDFDGDLHIGSISGGGGDTVTVSGNWDTAGITSVDLIGDAGDAAVMTHIIDSDFALSNITSANSNALDVFSNGSITASNISVGDLTLSYDDDNDSVSSNMLTLSGTNSVVALTLFGSNTNDTATLGGSWTIAGDVNVFQTNVLNIAANDLTANSFAFPTVNQINFGSGSTASLTATGGDIDMADFTSDRRVNLNASGNISLQAVTTSNDRLDVTAQDISGDGSAINLGTGLIQFQVQSGSSNISVGDGGVDTFTIESNIWDNLTVGSITLDAIGNTDTITFLEDTLPADLTIDGSDGRLTFNGTGQNIVGSQISTNTDVLFLQDFTSDSVVGITGAIEVGATNASAGDVLNLEGNWSIVSADGIDLLGDTGDTVNFVHVGNDFSPPAIVSSNGNPNLDIDVRRGLTLSGFEGGNLNVEIDYNNNGANTLTTTGTYSLTDLFVRGYGGNDDADINGNWTINGEARFNALSDVTFLNNSFVANDLLQVQAGTSITLGSSTTAFNLGSNTAYVQFDTLTGNRPLNITAPGSLFFNSVNVASRNLSLTSNDDLAGDEAVNGGFIQSGDLTIAGDMAWTTNPVISGDYVQTRGDVSFTDVNLSAFGVDLTGADSVTLSGTENTFEARSGDIVLANATDDGSNADLVVDATGAITLNSTDTGTGQITLTSDTNSLGDESIALSNVAGGTLTLNNNTTLTGSASFSALMMNGIELTASAFDSSDFGSVTLNGAANTFTVNGGDFLLSAPTVAAGSDLTMNVGAGNHSISGLSMTDSDIVIQGINGTSNQVVNANGAWAYDSLTVSGIDTFTTNGNLVASAGTEISASNDIVINDGATLSSNDISLTAGDDLTVTGLTATSQQVPSIVLTAGGDLIDGGDTNTDIQAYLALSVEYNIAGAQEILETSFEVGGDDLSGVTENIDSVIDSIASASDPTGNLVEVESDSNNPVDGVQASVGSLPKNRVDVFIPECNGNDRNCRKTNAVRRFLSALLIGGALPE